MQRIGVIALLLTSTAAISAHVPSTATSQPQLPPQNPVGGVTWVKPKTVQASNTYKRQVPPLAFDGNVGTYWSAGKEPTQWLEADLGKEYELTTILLFLSQTALDVSKNEIYISTNPIGNNLNGAQLVRTIHGRTKDADIIAIGMPNNQPRRARYVQFRCVQGRGWVAYREIMIGTGG